MSQKELILVMRCGSIRRSTTVGTQAASSWVMRLQQLAYLEGFETVQRDLGGACHELHKECQVLFVKLLHGLPEPLHRLAGCGVPAVLRVAPQVIHIDLRESTDQQLQLMIIEDADQILHMQSSW